MINTSMLGLLQITSNSLKTQRMWSTA